MLKTIKYKICCKCKRKRLSNNPWMKKSICRSCSAIRTQRKFKKKYDFLRKRWRIKHKKMLQAYYKAYQELHREEVNANAYRWYVKHK